ncbi:MAG: hypothetical protein GQ557_00880 [Mycoplasmataceae bacterium]|nr:hypothetical protein [Mycoplasmataceae bacterium]
MNTAKQNFDIFVSLNQTLPEVSQKDIENKMIQLKSSRITFAYFWTLFWMFFAFFFVIISIFMNASKYSKRSNYKDVELMRLQLKLNKQGNYGVSSANINTQQVNAQEVNQKIDEPIDNTPPEPVKQILDFHNFERETLEKWLTLSNVSYDSKISKHELIELIRNNDLDFFKLEKQDLKQILDANGMTTKINITKEEMIKLLK